MVPNVSADPLWRAYQRAAELPLATSPCAVPPHSVIMHELAEQIAALGGGSAPVLILGEAGLAKRCHAHAIHERGLRKEKSFASVSCIGLELSAFEGLFGEGDGDRHSLIAHDRRHVLEASRGGSLFLGEVGALDHEMQDALLQILSNGALKRRGAGATIDIDVRVMASSSVDLVEAVNEGRFREDLYYRLSSSPVSVPPVRVRGGDDVVQLLDHLTRMLALSLYGCPSRLSQPAVQRLVRYPWPGNIREMRNALERAMVAARGTDTIALSHLSAEVRDPLGFDGEYVPRSLSEMERSHIERTLHRHRQNRTHAANELGISRATLIKKIRGYGLVPRGGSRSVDAEDDALQ